MVAYRITHERVPRSAEAFGWRLSRTLSSLLILLCARPALAFLDPPYLAPPHPTAGQTISVNVYGGQCDLLHDGVFPPIVTREDAAITIVFSGIHEGDPEWCYFGIGTVTYAIGAFEPGEYSLDVKRHYFNFAGVLIEESLGIIPFRVTGGSPSRPAVAAPTSSAAALSVLLLALAVLARRRLRGHGRETYSKRRVPRR